jgi:hypothetical protein
MKMEKEVDQKIRSTIELIEKLIRGVSPSVEAIDLADQLIAEFGWDTVFPVMSRMGIHVSDATILFMEARNYSLRKIKSLLLRDTK